MSELFDKSIRTLELPRVLQMLADQAVSAEAKTRALAVRPETETEEVLRLLDQTDAARTMIGLRGSPSFSGVKPVAQSLDRADRGGGLNTRELLTIADLLTAARRAKEYFNADAAEKTAIDHLFLSLHGNRFLEEKIKWCIVDEDTIADAASTELADIRRHMRAAQAKSRQILQRIISSPSYSKVLQEAIITQRDGRFVVPVKAEHKGDLPGLVHDISSTGATLFVEPRGVVQANNEYIELEAKEQKEIERILAELSAEAAAHREDIQWDYDALVHLDLIFARGQLSYKMDAIRPEVRRDGAIRLRKARHPLLDAKRAVAIDIELGEAFDTLVITGPNTGGKTVSLKTLGLLTLMAQCGLHIPAGDRSAVTVYRRVLADIGDEQSIEQSLSTFSSHMVNIIRILQVADSSSLILLDELGAGTDPVEGAALAQAIIQELRGKGVRLACTTHYAELKAYAIQTPGVENGSCEFDVATLQPTYRLLIGVPGKSNAFAITQRLGMDPRIVDQARELVSRESNAFEQVVGRLEEDRRKMEDQLETLRASAAQAQQSAQEADRLKEEAEAQAKKEVERARQEAAQIVQKTRQRADALVNELEELRRQKNKQLSAEQKARLRSGMKDLESSSDPVHQRRDDNYVLPRPLVVGDDVLLYDIDKEATVLEEPKDGMVLVQAGIIKTRVPLHNIRLMSKRQLKKKNPGRTVTKSVSTPEASSSLDLRGQTVEEALMEVDSFLDRAARMHLSQVTIIHGKGTGALRAAVQQHLRRCAQVKSFRLGTYGEGESGVTIAELK